MSLHEVQLLSGILNNDIKRISLKSVDYLNKLHV